jgi:hypothetical protein
MAKYGLRDILWSISDGLYFYNSNPNLAEHKRDSAMYKIPHNQLNHLQSGTTSSANKTEQTYERFVIRLIFYKA